MAYVILEIMVHEFTTSYKIPLSGCYGLKVYGTDLKIHYIAVQSLVGW